VNSDVLPMEKKNLFLVFALFFIFFCLISVSAITGKIGNGRMTLNLETGETLDKAIRVINDNDVALNIELSASGDLKDDIEIIDESFILQPGEEKNARFTITANEPGTFFSRVNVQFTPEQGGNGVGLASVITTIISGETKNKISQFDIENSFKFSSKKTQLTAILLSISALMFLVFLIALFYYLKKDISKKEKDKKKNAEKIKKVVEEK